MRATPSYARAASRAVGAKPMCPDVVKVGVEVNACAEAGRAHKEILF
jgi:hypothetical protein